MIMQKGRSIWMVDEEERRSERAIEVKGNSYDYRVLLRNDENV